MLHLMRKHAGSWLIKVILGAIVVVFVFWGIGSFREQKAARVARVNGEPISVMEYRQSYNDLIERLRASFGNNLDEELIEKMQVKEQALNQLIDQKLLLQEARRVNLGVSNEELSKAIKMITAFQTGGIFDNRLYQKVLNLNRLTPDEFEETQRKSLILQKFRLFIQSGIRVSEEEVDDFYRWRNSLANFNYVIFEPSAYKEINPPAEEVKLFFEQNKTLYKIEEKRKVKYLRMDPDKLKNKVTSTSEWIKQYYDSNPAEFSKPKTVEARHILIKVASDAASQVVEEKKAKALEILKMARDKKNFAALAKTYSEDSSKDSGGIIGPFERESMVEPFSDAAFALKVGEVSEPIRTQFGWHIIKVEKINEAHTLSFKEVEPRIRKKLVDEKARSFAYDQAEVIYDMLIDGADIEKVAKSQGVDLYITEAFDRKGPVSGVSQSQEFISAAFQLPPMEISEILKLTDGYYILQVIEKIPQRIPDIAEVQDKVKTDLIQKKQEEKAKNEAEKLLEALKNGKSLTEESRLRGIKMINSGFVKRNDAVPGLGYEPEVLNTVFSLSPDRKTAQSPTKGKTGYCVMEFVERKYQDGGDAKSEKDQIARVLLQQKQLISFNEFLAQLKKKSQIRVEEDFSTKGSMPVQSTPED